MYSLCVFVAWSRQLSKQIMCERKPIMLKIFLSGLCIILIQTNRDTWFDNSIQWCFWGVLWIMKCRQRDTALDIILRNTLTFRKVWNELIECVAVIQPAMRAKNRVITWFSVCFAGYNTPWNGARYFFGDTWETGHKKYTKDARNYLRKIASTLVCYQSDT